MTDVQVRFFGGPAADRVIPWPAHLLDRGARIQVPEPPRYPIDTLDDGPDFPPVHDYRWDGTVNERGEYRMRWSPPPGWTSAPEREFPFAERLLRELGLG